MQHKDDDDNKTLKNYIHLLDYCLEVDSPSIKISGGTISGVSSLTSVNLGERRLLH